MKVIIAGSALGERDTIELVKTLHQLTGWDWIDLNHYNIGYFDYDHANRNDDFLPLIKDIISKYDTLIFATPVYWYAMSGIMKVFFDRISDLLTIEKSWGRKLRGKKMAALSISYGNNLGEAFWLPFKATADYLGMEFLTGLHTLNGEDYHEKLAFFAKCINGENLS